MEKYSSTNLIVGNRSESGCLSYRKLLCFSFVNFYIFIMPKTAPVKWAQQDDRVFITFLVADAAEVSVDWSDSNVVFTCTAN